MEDDMTRPGADRVDMYANHLYMADFGHHLAQRLRIEAEREMSAPEAAYLRGYAQAVDDVAAHLEAGEALPGGPLYLRTAAAFAAE